jgi:hypothetical protein
MKATILVKPWRIRSAICRPSETYWVEETSRYSVGPKVSLLALATPCLESAPNVGGVLWKYEAKVAANAKTLKSLYAGQGRQIVLAKNNHAYEW